VLWRRSDHAGHGPYPCCAVVRCARVAAIGGIPAQSSRAVWLAVKGALQELHRHRSRSRCCQRNGQRHTAHTWLDGECAEGEASEAAPTNGRYSRCDVWGAQQWTTEVRTFDRDLRSLTERRLISKTLRGYNVTDSEIYVQLVASFAAVRLAACQRRSRACEAG
jgi:hypothetical protein